MVTSSHPANPEITPVYNVEDYGEDKFIPIGYQDSTASVQTFPLSSAVITRDLDGTVIPIEDEDSVLDATDRTLYLIHLGNNTQFNRTYEWTPDMDATVYKTAVRLAIGLNVSAFTTGSFNLSRIQVTVTAQNPSKVLYDNVFNSTSAAIAATGIMYHIFERDVLDKFTVYGGQPIQIRIIVTVSTGTGTRQEGIVPVFAYHSTSGTYKPFALSGIGFHLHAALSHADPIFRDNSSRISVIP